MHGQKEPFHHRDRSLLRKTANPTPNPLAALLPLNRFRRYRVATATPCAAFAIIVATACGCETYTA